VKQLLSVKTDYRPSAKAKKSNKEELPTRRLRYIDGKWSVEQIIYA